MTISVCAGLPKVDRLADGSIGGRDWRGVELGFEVSMNGLICNQHLDIYYKHLAVFSLVDSYSTYPLSPDRVQTLS